MKAGIRTYLMSSATMAAAVTGVYSFPAPQEAVKPYLMLSRVAGQCQNIIGATLDIENETWQVDVMADTDRAAEIIKRLVIARLNIADRVEMGSYSCYSCTSTGVTDNSDLEMTGSETPDIRTTLTFDMIRETTPTSP